jgi:hypothetical protein
MLQKANPLKKVIPFIAIPRDRERKGKIDWDNVFCSSNIHIFPM